MSEVNHSYAFYKGLPLTGSTLTPDGGSALSTARIIGEITEEKERRINLEDEDESGHLVGEVHDDLTVRIMFKLGIPTGAAIPDIHSVITIASTAFSSRWAGVWKVEKIGLAFKNKDRVEVPVTLVKHEYFDYAEAA